MYSRGHSFDPNFMKLRQNKAKTRSLGQIIGKHCEHSKGLSFGPKFIKLYQNVNTYEI